MYHEIESQVSRIKNGASHNPECCEEGNRVFKQKINKNNCLQSYWQDLKMKLIFKHEKQFTSTQELDCLLEVGADIEIQSTTEDLYMAIGSKHDRTRGL